ncbi:hypothetical protein AVEN_92205-1 [Araneus ventricosus]|uniref:Uncharacterized protein n=1 Tax=Araneus ventricosus TaxID=182803 RepID=A0A4Y2AMQ3_ARAVE|nr:hypothetical protein AVEN_92205-1 [Araneus ventricosus]
MSGWLKIPVLSNRCNTSSTEAGVLIAYHQATNRHLPKEVRTITDGGNPTSIISISPGESSARLLIRRPFIRVLMFPQGRSQGGNSISSEEAVNQPCHHYCTSRGAGDLVTYAETSHLRSPR